MKPAILLVAACACGGSEVTNDAFYGIWNTLPNSTDDCPLTMVLSPGPTGLSGSLTGHVDCFGTAMITTPPGRQTLLVGSLEYRIEILRNCPGEPVQDISPPRIHFIRLVPVTAGFPAMLFVREGPAPDCVAFTSGSRDGSSARPAQNQRRGQSSSNNTFPARHARLGPWSFTAGAGPA